MVAVSILGLVVYVLGIPAYVLATMSYAMMRLVGLGVTPHRGIALADRYANHKDKFKEATYLQILGFLYTLFGALPVPPSFRLRHVLSRSF